MRGPEGCAEVPLLALIFPGATIVAVGVSDVERVGFVPGALDIGRVPAVEGDGSALAAVGEPSSPPPPWNTTSPVVSLITTILRTKRGKSAPTEHCAQGRVHLPFTSFSKSFKAFSRDISKSATAESRGGLVMGEETEPCEAVEVVVVEAKVPDAEGAYVEPEEGIAEGVA